MIDYSLVDNGETMLLSIPNQGNWGTICFAWEKTNVEFTTALNNKGLDFFIDLLIKDPNTAYTLMLN